MLQGDYFPQNRYTDAPALHSNPILASLQLCFWVFIRPTAWRNYVPRLDPSLRPDFSLANLDWKRRYDRALVRAMVAWYLAWPLLAGALIIVLRVSLGRPLYETVRDVLPAVMYSLFGGTVIGATVSVAASLAYSTIAVLLIGLLGSDPVGLGLAYAALTSITGSAAISVTDWKGNNALRRQVGGILVGILIAVAALGLLYSVVSGLALGMPNATRVGAAASPTLSAAFGLAVGVLVGGICGAMIGWRAHSWRRGVLAGSASGLVLALAYGAMIGTRNELLVYLAAGAAGGISVCCLFALLYLLAKRAGGPWAGAIAGAVAVSFGWLPLAPFTVIHPIQAGPILIIGPLCIILGLTLPWWRPIVLYPFFAAWNTVLYYADLRRTPGQPTLLRHHSAFWDEQQRFRLLGLDDHLVLAAERRPEEGQAAMHYLTTTRQRWAARAARTELDVRKLERCANVEAIGQIARQMPASGLPGPARILFAHFARMAEDVNAALTQTTVYHQRTALHNVAEQLNNLIDELTRSSDRYAARFYPVATHWYDVINQHLSELASEAEIRQEIDNPYIFGIPLCDRQAMFVGRTDIAARIEQLLLDARRPPLLLYGQRRMGKTSLLRNLGRLLPSTIIPLFVDGEGLSGARDYPALLHRLGQQMARSAEEQRAVVLPSLDRVLLSADPFTYFNEWLDQVEQVLDGKKQSIALLALDEFEALDSVLSRERFDEADFLRMLRHLIQHRPRFKVLLAGSHLFEEFQRWASYLINVQVVKVSYLENQEAWQLIEHPVRDFALRYEPAASSRVLELTRGHPYLLQLLCYEIVELKNEQQPEKRRLATIADVEAAVPRALNTGGFFFAEIRNQLGDATFAAAQYLAEQGEGTIFSRNLLYDHTLGETDQALATLLKRDIVEPSGEGYQFQVEMIRRWIAQQVSLAVQS